MRECAVDRFINRPSVTAVTKTYPPEVLAMARRFYSLRQM